MGTFLLYNYRILFLIGLGLFSIAIIMFLWTHLDERLNLFFLSDSSGLSIHWIKLVSKSGSFAIVLPLSLLLVVWTWFYRSHQDAVWFLIILISARLVFLLMKIIIFRPRPVFPHSLIHATTASFPSGHAVNGLVFILILLFCLHRYNYVLWLALIWVITIGWTRLALGAHWTSDILAGWGCAMMWFAFMMELKDTSFIQRILGYNL